MTPQHKLSLIMAAIKPIIKVTLLNCAWLILPFERFDTNPDISGVL